MAKKIKLDINVTVTPDQALLDALESLAVLVANKVPQGAEEKAEKDPSEPVDSGLRGKQLFKHIVQIIERDALHWRQDSWGSVKLDLGDKVKIVDPETGDVKEVTASNGGNPGLKFADMGINPYVDSMESIQEVDYDKLSGIEYLPASCGTAYCVAGHAVVLSGARMKWHPTIGWDENYHHDRIVGFTAEECVLPDGTVRFVGEYAAELLDLAEIGHDDLFNAGNSLPDVKRIGAELYARKQRFEERYVQSSNEYDEYDDDSD